MEGAERGPSRGKRVGDGVPIDSRGQCLSDHVQECIACGIAAFPIGSYVHIRSAHAACMQSVLSMAQLLKKMFTRAPEGISAGVVGWEVARAELNKQGCRPAGRCSCTGNQVCDGALQAHGAATQEV